eukprot:CAMPEP_0202908812 /NCGR_PEP_ID=MMETSP1392-20130828/47296_1 /ASSEMBLY_ACC=CAM_ASM_000868 /TAXON_ID=225041 /ORGANISM="Chlamydomonas chlamydogama, Strain SAG 11-48b" /LENGTH=154 /DNA_ID=CAMNT_0049598319 /DNA_START=1 /DNA_END=465 /DNA_ORIENTATION=-
MAAYKRADAFVFPAHADASVASLSQAVACGIPVVVPSQGGPHMDLVKSYHASTTFASTRSECDARPCAQSVVYGHRSQQRVNWTMYQEADLAKGLTQAHRNWLVRHQASARGSDRTSSTVSRTEVRKQGIPSWDDISSMIVQRIQVLMAKAEGT